jgi:nicotinamide-nucleotide adenylyltransferase
MDREQRIPKTAGIIGRWQPPHRGHQLVLQALCKKYRHVVIGVGSANRSDYRNPFEINHTLTMLELVLRGFNNFTLVPIDDHPDDEEWCDEMVDHFRIVDDFFSANPFVKSLLNAALPVHHPARILGSDETIKISGTEVRRLMARDLDWQSRLPRVVSTYINDHHLDIEFRQAFGLHTLALETIIIN